METVLRLISAASARKPTLGTSPMRVRTSGSGTRPRAVTARARITKPAETRKSRKGEKHLRAYPASQNRYLPSRTGFIRRRSRRYVRTGRC